MVSAGFLNATPPSEYKPHQDGGKAYSTGHGCLYAVDFVVTITFFATVLLPLWAFRRHVPPIVHIEDANSAIPRSSASARQHANPNSLASPSLRPRCWDSNPEPPCGNTRVHKARASIRHYRLSGFLSTADGLLVLCLWRAIPRGMLCTSSTQCSRRDSGVVRESTV